MTAETGETMDYTEQQKILIAARKSGRPLKAIEDNQLRSILTAMREYLIDSSWNYLYDRLVEGQKWQKI